jgi:hypothetical protein
MGGQNRRESLQLAGIVLGDFLDDEVGKYRVALFSDLLNSWWTGTQQDVHTSSPKSPSTRAKSPWWLSPWFGAPPSM